NTCRRSLQRSALLLRYTPLFRSGSCNKRMVGHADPLAVTALELGAGTLALTLLAPLLPFLLPALASDLLVMPDLHNGVLLLALSDRKSTRLNSSHVKMSYAVFCF